MNLTKKEAASANLPFATITFNLDACRFRKEGDGFERIPNSYIKRNTTHEVVEVIDGQTYKLATGEYVQSLPNNPAIVTFGKLVIHRDGVKVFSRNGLLLRRVSESQKFNVYSIYETTTMMTLYKINDKEVILSQEGVEFIKGYFKPSKSYSAVYKGKQLILNPNKSYPYNQISGSQIRLNGYDDFWIDVTEYKGKIEIS